MSQKKTVDAAIIGLGRWGQNLVSAASSDPQCRLKFTRAVTRTPEKAKAFCDQNNLPLDTSFDAVLRDRDISAVVLATPHSQHTDQIIAAVAAGKNVFVEKPLALSLGEATRAVAAAKAAGRVLAVGFNRRFLPAFIGLKALLEDGSLGSPLHIEANFSGPFGYNFSADMWRGTVAENPAGGMASMGIHMLDAMVHLLGPVCCATAQSHRRVLQAPIDDTTSALLEFTSGADASLTTMMATAPYWRFHLFGASGWALMPDQNSLEWSGLDGKIKRKEFAPVDTLALELDAFAGAVCGGAAFPVTGVEALCGVAAMHAIADSIEKGKFISVSQNF
jgi:predicted dehydrogenase